VVGDGNRDAARVGATLHDDMTSALVTSTKPWRCPTTAPRTDQEHGALMLRVLVAADFDRDQVRRERAGWATGARRSGHSATIAVVHSVRSVAWPTPPNAHTVAPSGSSAIPL